VADMEIRKHFILHQTGATPGLDMALPDGSVRVEFRIENRGRRGARDYYWHVYLPRVWPYDWEGGVVKPVHKDRIYRRGGQWFKYFAGYIDQPLHPKRASTIGSMVVPVSRFPFPIEWQVTSDDGSFPGDDPGKLEVRLEDRDDDALQKETEA
jgi:hypothetical protein